MTSHNLKLDYSVEKPPTPDTLKRSAVTLIVALICLFAVIGPGLRFDTSYAPWVDDVWLTGPLFCEASRQVATGHLPLLDWSTLETFHHNAHFTPVYPLYFFGILDFCSVAKAVQSQDVIRFVHLGILFANALFLGRVVGLRWVGSAFAAVAIATSLNARELATFPTIVAAAAWLPLALAGLLLILEKRAYAWGAAVFVGAVSLLLYAGPGSNMIAGFAFLCLILFCGWAVRTVRATGLQGLVTPLLVLTVCAIALLLLNLGSTINLLLHIEEMIRWTRSGPVVGSSGSDNIREILTEQRAASDFFSVFIPEVKPYAAGAFFAPACLWLLAVVGWWRFHRSGLVAALAFVVVSVLFFVFFDFGNLALGFGFIPGLSHIRHLSLLGTPLSICVALLAGFGIDSFERASGGQRSWIGMLLCLLVALAVVSGWMFNASAQTHSLGFVANLLALLLLGVFFADPRVVQKAPVVATSALLVLSVAGVFWHPQVHLHAVTDASLRSQRWRSVEDALDRIKAVTPDPGRVAIEKSIRADELQYGPAGSIAIYKGIPTFQFYLSPRIYWKFKAENYRFPDYGYYALRGAKWLLAGKDLRSPALKLDFTVGGVRAYRLVHGRDWVGGICGAQTIDIGSTPGQPGRLPDLPDSVSQSAAARWASQEDDCSGAKIADLNFSAQQNRITWTTTQATPRQLVINVPPYRGWRLTVGNLRVPLFNLGDTQVLAVLPRDAVGSSELTYLPGPYLARLLVSAGAALVLIVGLLLGRKRLSLAGGYLKTLRRRRRPDPIKA